MGARNVEQFRRRYTWDMGNRLLVARDEITGRVARYDYDEFDNLISAEYERGGEVERLYRVPDRMDNLAFKEFKEMALRGGIVAPINKERLETELYIYGRQRKPPLRVHSIQVSRAV